MKSIPLTLKWAESKYIRMKQLQHIKMYQERFIRFGLVSFSIWIIFDNFQTFLLNIFRFKNLRCCCSCDFNKLSFFLSLSLSLVNRCHGCYMIEIGKGESNGEVKVKGERKISWPEDINREGGEREKERERRERKRKKERESERMSKIK